MLTDVLSSATQQPLGWLYCYPPLFLALFAQDYNLFKFLCLAIEMVLLPQQAGLLIAATLDCSLSKWLGAKKAKDLAVSDIFSLFFRSATFAFALLTLNPLGLELALPSCCPIFMSSFLALKARSLFCMCFACKQLLPVLYCSAHQYQMWQAQPSKQQALKLVYWIHLSISTIWCLCQMWSTVCQAGCCCYFDHYAILKSTVCFQSYGRHWRKHNSDLCLETVSSQGAEGRLGRHVCNCINVTNGGDVMQLVMMMFYRPRSFWAQI